MSFSVETLPSFDKEVKKLAKKFPSLKSDLAKLARTLSNVPKQGVSLGNDFYKIRFKITSKGKGKSGGGRIITCVKVIEKKVFLSAIYDKGERETISEAELKIIAREIAKMISLRW